MNALDASHPQEARRLLDHGLKTNAGEVTLYLEICRCAEEKKQWAVMADYARRGLQACPKAPAESRFMLYSSLASGLLETRPGHWQDETLQAAEQAHNLAPKDPVYQNLYGYALAETRRDKASLVKAEILVRTALETLARLPDNPDTRLKRALTQDSFGWIRYRREDYDTAGVALNDALRTLPDDLPVVEARKVIYYHLGAACHKMKRYEAAQRALQSALTLDPNYTDARNELASLSDIAQ